jgi:hypothetical protein
LVGSSAQGLAGFSTQGLVGISAHGTAGSVAGRFYRGTPGRRCFAIRFIAFTHARSKVILIVFDGSEPASSP